LQDATLGDHEQMFAILDPTSTVLGACPLARPHGDLWTVGNQPRHGATILLAMLVIRVESRYIHGDNL
jgi:hypothetical protein